MTKKLNIDKIVSNMTSNNEDLEVLIDLLDSHIKQQNNTSEKKLPEELRDTLKFYSEDLTKARQEIQFSIIEYAYWYGGACQKLD